VSTCSPDPSQLFQPSLSLYAPSALCHPQSPRTNTRPPHVAVFVGLLAETVKSIVTCPSSSTKPRKACSSVANTLPASPPSFVQKFLGRSSTPEERMKSMQEYIWVMYAGLGPRG